MTAAGPGRRILVLDTMCLGHFARADRLDVLGDLLVPFGCWTTGVVVEELRVGATAHRALQAATELDWLRVARLDSLDEIRRFATWVRRIGAGERDVGEASVLATAELRGGTAVSDDREAALVGRRHGLDVHGTIWLLAGACRGGKLTPAGAGSLIELLRATGLRLPCTGAEFPDYARRHGLL